MYVIAAITVAPTLQWIIKVVYFICTVFAVRMDGVCEHRCVFMTQLF